MAIQNTGRDTLAREGKNKGGRNTTLGSKSPLGSGLKNSVKSKNTINR